jgi:c-di-GMP-related signal transduction protein
MLALPMSTVVQELPVRAAIHQALLGAAIKERCLLSWIECVESNHVTASEGIADTYFLNQQELVKAYMESLVSNAPDPVLGH